MLLKRMVIVLVLFLFSIAGVFAASVSLSSNSATIASASDLYAYEIKMTYSGGTPSGAAFNNFLGGGTSGGTNVKGDYFYVYESKLDSTRTGVSGGGTLFSVTTAGTAATATTGFFMGNGLVEYMFIEENYIISVLGGKLNVTPFM